MNVLALIVVLAIVIGGIVWLVKSRTPAPPVDTNVPPFVPPGPKPPGQKPGPLDGGFGNR